MSPQNKMIVPCDPPARHVIDSLIDALRRVPWSANEVKAWVLPILGFRRANGTYLMTEAEVARLMRADQKTANRFMRRGQDYKCGGNLRMAAQAVGAAGIHCDYFLGICGGRRDEILEHFSDFDEAMEYRKLAEAFKVRLGTLPLQYCLPFGGGLSGERGALALGRIPVPAEVCGVLVRKGAVYGSPQFDHSGALRFGEELMAFHVSDRSYTKEFFVLLDTRWSVGLNRLVFEIKDPGGRVVHEAEKIVYAETEEFQPALFQVPGLFDMGSGLVALVATCNGVRCWNTFLYAGGRPEDNDIYFEGPDPLDEIVGSFLQEQVPDGDL